ncbi:MAG TPA: hypothetical protein VEI03_01925 [Stellaceae bacterium]|nr:hypothetical protein [Stellaceae bacterium]
MERGGRTRLAAASAPCAPALPGCGRLAIPASPLVPAEASGHDPILAESSIEADAVMTRAAIDTERAGIAQSRRRLGPSSAASEPSARDGALARRAAMRRRAAGSL